MTFNTGNPIGSTDARDLSDNAENFDHLENSTTKLTHSDRLGTVRKTRHGMEVEHDAQIAAHEAEHYNQMQSFENDFDGRLAGMAFTRVGSFTTGATLTDMRQVLVWEVSQGGDGHEYGWAGTFPKVVAAGSTPATSGGIGAGAWVDRTDVTLRHELAGAGGADMIGFQQPFTGAVARTQHQKNADILAPSDFSTESDMLRALISQGKNSAVFNSRYVFTITAGIGGDYPNLMDAIVAAQGMRPLWDNGHGYCEIKLKSGYVLNSQMEFGAGVDLSWIKITSEDTIVYADTAAFTKTYFGYANYKYLFSFADLAKSPVFSFLIQETRTTSSDVVAFLVNSGASLHFAPGSGARYFLRGVQATYGANVIGLFSGNGGEPPAGYFLCDFSYCTEACLVAMFNCRVHLPYSLFEHCPGDAVACVWSTVGEFRYSSVSYCTGTGWIVRDASVVSIRDHKSIQCGSAGLNGYHGALIDARCHHTNDNGTVLDSSKLLGFYGCVIGAALDSECRMDVSGTDMRQCGTALYATRSCSYVAHSCNFDGCTLVAQGNTKSDFSLTSGSALNINNLCSMQNMCSFVTWTFTYTGPSSTGTRFIDLRTLSKASFNNVTIDTNSAIFVENAAEVSFLSCTIGALRISSYYGSRVSIQDSPWNFTRVVSGTTILNVARGSTISAIGQRGTAGQALTCNITPLTLDKAGIIYYD